jgi:glycerol dehydrogenase
VIYSDSGDVLYSFFHEREILAILVDTDIIVNHCPPRMLASGIADAAAKYPEVAFSMEYAKDWEKSVLPSAALAMSKFDWEQFESKGAKAVADARTHRISEEVEDCLCAAIALTGTVSSLVSGGRQLAIAHTFYDSVCKNFKAQQKKFLHGEIVSVGIRLQMCVNGLGAKEIDEAERFLSSLGAPVAMRDIEIDPTPGNIEIIYKYIVENMGLTEDWMQDRLRYGLEKVIA